MDANINKNKGAVEDTKFQEMAIKQEYWSNNYQFIFALITMSIGVGNIWSFPFTTLEYGGGTFLIPYFIVLSIIGLPIYLLELTLGHFSGKGCTKVYDMCPAMRGVGIGQTVLVNVMSSYYAALIAIILKYLYDSFAFPLPWSYCHESWNISCVANHETEGEVAAEIYLWLEVLKETKHIDDGIGPLNPQLAFLLVFVWILTYYPLRNGIKTTGEASYFLGLFPHIILTLLFIRTITLPGALNGMKYLFVPQWDYLFRIEVWVAALSHCFLSYGICLSMVITYASYEKLDTNVARNAILLCSINTITSIVASLTFYGILGNLSYQIKIDIITLISKAGEEGLVSFFIYYPEAIAHYGGDFPQLFAVPFFFMLFTLGLGSNVAMVTTAVTDIRDYLNVSSWLCALIVCIVNCMIGFCYVTACDEIHYSYVIKRFQNMLEQTDFHIRIIIFSSLMGGQLLISLVDFYGVTIPSIVLAFLEIITFSWIYGCNRICTDLEFITQINVGYYWRICCTVLAPIYMFVILISIVFHDSTFRHYHLYPKWAINFGFCLTFSICSLFIIMLFSALIRGKGNLSARFKNAFASKYYHPLDETLLEKYRDYHQERRKSVNILEKIKINVLG